jgi:negative regulator of sigma E activity
MTSERDEQLSALLDGALSAAEEGALRDELARDPALAARLQELAGVDDALRALPARPAPSDLRARLQARLEADAQSARPARALAGTAGGGPPVRSGRRRAWAAGLSAAAAAAVAALLVVVGERDARRGGADVARSPAARAPEVARSGPAPALPGESAQPAGASGLAAESAPSSEALALRPDVAPSVEAARGASGEAAAPRDLAAASEIADAAALAAESAPSPALWVEATEDEARALDALDPADAGVVAVLDWLGALDALEAEAS